MPNKLDIPISIPRGYSPQDSTNKTKTSSSQPTRNIQEIKPKEVPDNINKVRKKLIKGVVRHDSSSN